jgi:SHS family lactate transporter-like MFS transporter
MGCVYGYVILLTFIGPEALHKPFDVMHDSDMAEAAGHDTIEAALRRRQQVGMAMSDSSRENVNVNEKGTARQTEQV